MSLKICFNNEIHRVSSLPDSIESLKSQIKTIFKDSLPKFWSLSYLDTENDKIKISKQEDIAALAIEAKASKTAIKIFIDVEEGKEALCDSFHSAQSNSIPENEEKVEEKIEEKVPEKVLEQPVEDLKIEVIEVEKPVEHKIEEVEAEKAVDLKEKAQKLISKLKDKFSNEEKKASILQKLNALKEKVCPEIQEFIEKKVKKIEKKSKELAKMKRGELINNIGNLFQEKGQELAKFLFKKKDNKKKETVEQLISAYENLDQNDRNVVDLLLKGTPKKLFEAKPKDKKPEVNHIPLVPLLKPVVQEKPVENPVVEEKPVQEVQNVQKEEVAPVNLAVSQENLFNVEAHKEGEVQNKAAMLKELFPKVNISILQKVVNDNPSASDDALVDICFSLSTVLNQ